MSNLLVVIFSASLIFSSGIASGQTGLQAPVERCGYERLTSYDTLQVFLAGLNGKNGIVVRRIATTVQGRSVSCCFISSSGRFGQDSTRLRVLLFAQQHGDEPAGKEAMTLLLARIARSELDDVLSRIDLLVVPQMNPDGAELRQRRTADSLDLNRNHMLLTSPAVKGLHDLFAEWRPQVTLDVHEYGPYSSAWSDSGFIKLADVQLGMLTNLNSSGELRSYQRAAVYPSVAAAMRMQAYAFQEYIVGSPGEGIRYSTTEPNDGRQSFGILNTLSFIQEGRGGKELEDRLERRARSQLASVEALLAFCASNAKQIRALVEHERITLSTASGRSIVLCMDHFSGGGSMTIPVRLVPSERDTTWQVRPLHDVVRPLVTRNLPSAYVIPRELLSIIELLKRHHVALDPVRQEKSVSADVYLVDSVQADTLESEWHPKPFMRRERRTELLHPGDVIARTDQLHSLFLGVLLEPESMWGLVKYPGFKFLLEKNSYPILRIP